MITKKHLFSLLLILIIGLAAISIATAYTGTGFSHNIPTSKYSDLSISDILYKYNETDCEIEESGICTKVVDGDTIYLDNGEKIRLVGVNTPEKGVDGYLTSKNFVQKLCLGKTVGIDIDNSKHTDKYGRTLSVVIIDGKNVNEMLLKEGLAEVMYIPPSEFYPYYWANNSTHIPDSYTSYSNSQSSQNTDDNPGSYIGNSNTGKFHEVTCKWAQKISANNKVKFNSRSEAINQGYNACKICNP